MKNKTNLLRGIIGALLGLILIFAALKIAKKIVANKAKPKIKVEKQINKVYTQVVENKPIPITINEKGSLQALRKVELYSEVQGILKPNSRLFKPGQRYAKGSILFEIDDSEFRASLIAQKSVLYNQITQVLPDLQLDYPEVFDKWKNYLSGFDIKAATPSLPEFTNDREKYFINSKSIITTYYNIKNLEERLSKFTIRSPFYGIVTESLVNPGSLIRTGQKLGAILSPVVYELPLSVNDSYQEYLKIGKKVTLHNLEKTNSWVGTIARINAVVNSATQGIEIYVQVTGKDLKEGMFLEADISGEKISSGFEISRKLLIENSKVFEVKENKLHLRHVEIAFYTEKSAIITNLPDGIILLQNAIPGAYEGMLVEYAETSN